jgi:thioester reductase-like protein
MMAGDPLPGLGERIRGVAGDIQRDNVGLAEDHLRRIVEETTHVIHGAATIRFDQPLEEARAINVGGTRRILALAEQMAFSGVLQRFMYISTSSVSGRRGGMIYEDDLEMGQQFFNTYEQSKCESERIVRNSMHRIPTTIVRPSVVIGDSRTGRTTSFNVIYVPLRLFHRGLLNALPASPDTLLDLVPVNWVCDVIVYLLCASASDGKVFHITAGPRRAVPLAEVTAAAALYFDKHSPLHRPRLISFVSMEEFRGRIAQRGSRADTLLVQLDTLIPYVTVSRLFDSAATDAMLSGSGIVLPEFRTYSDNIFRYCLETNWGKLQDNQH